MPSKSRYTLEYHDERNGVTVTMELPADLSLTGYAEHLTQFLQATGFPYLAELTPTTWTERFELEEEDTARRQAKILAGED